MDPFWNIWRMHFENMISSLYWRQTNLPPTNIWLRKCWVAIIFDEIPVCKQLKQGENVSTGSLCSEMVLLVCKLLERSQTKRDDPKSNSELHLKLVRAI